MGERSLRRRRRLQREDGDEDAEPERAAELMGDVDQSAGYAGVLGGDAGDAGGGQRAEARPWPAPKSTMGSAMPVR